MVICLAAACMLSSLSILWFFGNVVSGMKEPNMFQFMFGFLDPRPEVHDILGFSFGYMVLFLVQVAIIGLSIFTLILFWKDSKAYNVTKKTLIPVGILMALCVLAAILWFLCAGMSFPFNEIKDLGPGPEFYSIFQIISVILLIVSVYKFENEPYAFVRTKPKKNSGGYLDSIAKKDEKDADVTDEVTFSNINQPNDM